MTALILALALMGQAPERSWHTAIVNGQPVKVWGWREGSTVHWLPNEQPPSHPPAPPAADPSLPDGGPGGSSGNPSESPNSSGELPAYALNGVIESGVPAERVIYTNVPSLAPKLAREYGVQVVTEGPPPEIYPSLDYERVAAERFVFPICVLAGVLVIVGIKQRHP